MFFKDEIEDKVEQHKVKMKEIEILVDMLERESQSFFKELDVEPEQIQKFVGDESNFTVENWKQLQEEKQKLEERVDLALKNIPNPHKTKKTQESLQMIQPTWLFVR